MSLFRPPDSMPRMRPLSNKRSTVVSVLDVGTSKICCLIAKLRPREESQLLAGRTHNVEVLGIGHQRSTGIKSGVVIDLDAAEQAIRLAVDAAERMAGVTIDSLIVNVSCGRLSSETFSASVSLDGHEVEEGDIKRVLSAGSAHAEQDGYSVVHSIPIGYALDNDHGIHDPRNMMGEVLGVDMHVVNAETGPLRNLELSINRAHLSVETLVATPYASGLAALVEDETNMGCACIDIGGGTTTLSVFLAGRFVFTDAITIGGDNVTMDLARGLSTRLDEAERLKVLHGSTLPSVSDDNDIISVPPIGNDEQDAPIQVPRAQLTRIIRPRVEETLELIRERLNRSGFAGAVGKRIVMTGGASQLTGISEVARRILSRNVRLGRPLGIRGLPSAARGPAFSAVVGLLIYPQIAGIEKFSSHPTGRRYLTGTDGALARVGRWLKESL